MLIVWELAAYKHVCDIWSIAPAGCTDSITGFRLFLLGPDVSITTNKEGHFLLYRAFKTQRSRNSWVESAAEASIA